jgi:N-acetylglucosaminyldiphosphoundecaprenol N-acetyl-beta-D-mannosaminyltransferase
MAFEHKNAINPICVGWFLPRAIDVTNLSYFEAFSRACSAELIALSISHMKTIPLLGIRIADVSAQEALGEAANGGLILAPSAPGLCDLERDPHYRDALRGSDLNLADSGLAILLMTLRGLGRPRRLSGLGFLTELIHSERFKDQSSFWVMPSPQSTRTNLAWLQEQGLAVSLQNCHIAPLYPKTGPVEDPDLLKRLMEQRPHYVFLCTGSGSQEKLGHWLMTHLDYRPCIACIGAAIAFLSGDQAPVPRWADRLCLGWFLRILSDPARFLPRYLAALRLIPLVMRYGSAEPPLVPLSAP